MFQIFKMDKVIFTNCGLLGDMFLCLPVISWYYKTYGVKPIFGVSRHFNYAETAEEIKQKFRKTEQLLL